MATSVPLHIDEEALEKYSIGKLSTKLAARVEEHLLICERCRQNLKARDTYVVAMRRAAAELRRAEGKPKRHLARSAGVRPKA